MRKPKLFSSALAVIASLALLTSCSGESANTPTDKTSQPAAPASEPAAPGDDHFPVTIQHPAGELTLESQPSKIAVFNTAALDTLDVIGADDLVAGVPAKATPSWLEGKFADATTIGSLFEPDLEALAKLQPDLIIIGARSASMYETLSKDYKVLDTTVAWDQPNYAERVADSVELVGQAVGKVDEAKAAAQKIKDAVAKYKDVGKGKGTAMVIMASGTEISMHGPKSRWSPIFDILGLEPVGEDKADIGHKGQKISFETIKEMNPDYIFVVDRDAAVGEGEGETAKQILDNELVKATNASKNDRILYLSPERWYIVMQGAQNFEYLLNEIGEFVESK